jgi:multidrug transporter EmrE-like cation transporter
MGIYLLLILYIACSGTALLFIKSGTSELTLQLGKSALQLGMGYNLLIGAALYVASFLMSVALMQKMDLSYMYPIAAGVINAFVCVASVFVLKESVSAAGWVGIALISVGVVLINVGK